MRSKSPELMNEIRKFAENYCLTHNCSPSTTEIAEGVGIARGTAYKYLVAMNDQGLIRYDGRNIVTSLTEKLESTHLSVPACGSIPCGIPTEEIERIESIVALPTAIFGSGELFILMAQGDSMTDAGIDDGDLVVIKKQPTAREGDIVAALVDKESHNVILRAENENYKDIVCKTDC